MTQLYQRNPRHVFLARQGPGGNGNGNGNHNGNGGIGLLPVPSTSQAAGSSTFSTSVSSASSQSSSVPVQSSTSSSVQSSQLAVTSSTTPTILSSTSVSTSASKSDTPSTTINSSTTPSTSQSSQSTTSILQETTLPSSILNTNQFTPTNSLNYGAPTSVSIPVSTTSAPPLTGPSSNLSAGNIVGAVAGTLIGLAALSFLVVFILRRYRRSRRRAMRDSDFGNFRRSMFATSRPSSATHTMRNMSETNIAPSLKEPYVPYSATTVQLPSQALAAATAATTPASGGSGLQERPKYVYGQDPSPTNQQQQNDDNASDTHGGAYSSQPQVQGAYNAEAYGGYAKYEDVGDGIVGSVPTGTAVYQDAQRAYQGQQGYDHSHYDPTHYAPYNQSQYQGYGQQQQDGTYLERQPHHPQAYAMGPNHAKTGDVTFTAI